MRSTTARQALPGLAALVLSLLPASALASPSDHPLELLLNLGIGVSRTSGAPGLALRYGFRGVYWLTSAIAVGADAMGFENVASWASDNIGCQPGRHCHTADPRNRSGWLVEPRLLVGTSASILRFYGGAGVGIAREDVPVVGGRSYLSWTASVEGGVIISLWRACLVPAVRFDAMDGGASAVLDLGLGANF